MRSKTNPLAERILAMNEVLRDLPFPNAVSTTQPGSLTATELVVKYRAAFPQVVRAWAAAQEQMLAPLIGKCNEILVTHNYQGPPPRYGTRKNPKTGATETYELPPPVDLEKARKGLADVLHGGGWFDDPLAKPKEKPAEDFHDGAHVVGSGSAAADALLEDLGMHETFPGSGVWVFWVFWEEY